MKMIDYYELLGIKKEASEQDIERWQKNIIQISIKTKMLIKLL